MNDAETRAEHIDPLLAAAGRFTYASNGQGIYGIDMHTGVEGGLQRLPEASLPGTGLIA